MKQSDIDLSGVAGFPIDIGRHDLESDNIAKIVFEEVHAIISDVPHAVTRKTLSSPVF